MDRTQRYRLEALSDLHPVADFDSGEPEIDDYLRNEALRDVTNGLARTFVEIDTEKPAANVVAGFFTLRAHALSIKCDYFEYLQDEDEDCVIEVPLVELMC